VEDELAAGGGGIDRLLEAPESDPAVGELGDGVDLELGCWSVVETRA
jgi:hypothetical protein